MAERRKDMGKLGKHDHKLTNLLKGGIFSLIMLAPLIAIGVSCLYVVNNKNAYQSYYGETINEEKLTTIETLPNNYQDKKFHFASNTTAQPTNNMQNRIYVNSITNLQSTISTTNQELILSSASYFICTYYAPNNYLVWYDENNTQLAVSSLQTYIVNFDFTTTNITLQTTFQQAFADYISMYEYNNYSYLDNVFYYSIHNLEQQSTFNWVQNTAIYTPLNAMCSGLGITESAIPILLCYWSLMTAIYIVFDIIIYLFTKMTHFIGTN